MNILEASHIIKDYTGHRALDDVSIEVPEKSIYGLLGPNGAGKTTLIRIINHITAPDSGTVSFCGEPLTSKSISDIGYLPEERGLYKKMRVGEQAVFFARLKGMTTREATRRLKEWFERLEISGWWDKRIEELSKGMAQKVQFIITVLHRPKLLIFDEPFSGFDPINANILKREILRLRDEGATVIFSTHNMGSVEELCDSITLINKSRNILTGRIDELRRKYCDGNYRLTFNGDIHAMTKAIEPYADKIYSPDTDPDASEKNLIFTLKDNQARRPLIAAANNTADIHGFEAILPSVDNIFIQAVNATTNQ